MNKEIKWKRVMAGTKLPGDCIVIYDIDHDPRLSRCAIYDGHYILIEELKKLPKE